MTKLSIIAALLCLGGFLILIFQSISSLMNPGDIVWKTICITDVVDPAFVEWIDGISWQVIQTPIRYVATLSLYILLFSLGVLTFIISGITGK